MVIKFNTSLFVVNRTLSTYVPSSIIVGKMKKVKIQHRLQRFMLLTHISVCLAKMVLLVKGMKFKIG